MSFTEHFTERDFACKDGCGYGTHPDDVVTELPQLLEAARLTLGRPIYVTSGCRCAKHNEAEGGKPTSAHTRGAAADLRISGGLQRWETLVALIVGALWMMGMLRSQPWLALARLRTVVRGLGVGPTFVHVDVDEQLADDGKRPAAWGYGAEQP